MHCFKRNVYPKFIFPINPTRDLILPFLNGTNENLVHSNITVLLPNTNFCLAYLPSLKFKDPSLLKNIFKIPYCLIKWKCIYVNHTLASMNFYTRRAMATSINWPLILIGELYI